MTVDDALKLARDYGVRVTLEGNDLALEAEAQPPPGVVAILGRGKRDIVAVLRQRKAEERRRIVQWVNDHFTPSPADICAHCREGPRPEDPFVLLFVGSDRGEAAQLMSFGMAGGVGGRGLQSARHRGPPADFKRRETVLSRRVPLTLAVFSVNPRTRCRSNANSFSE